MDGRYPAIVDEYIAKCLSTIIEPTILPDPQTWDVSEGIKKLIKQSQITIDKSPYPFSMLKYYGDRFDLHFSYGQILSLREIINFSYNYGLFGNMLHTNIEEFEIFIRDEHIKNNSFLADYSYLMQLPDDCSFQELFSTNILPVEDDFICTHLVLDYALAFICLHERAHVLRGHWDYLRNEFNKDIETILKEAELHNLRKEMKQTDPIIFMDYEGLTRQALELDADIYAFYELVHRNTQESYNFVYEYPFIKTKKDILYLTCCAISLALILSKQYYYRSEIFDQNILDPSTRLSNIVLLVKNIPFLSEEEKEEIMGGISKTLDMMDYIHVNWGVMNSSNIFRFQGDDSVSVLWGENAVSHLENIVNIRDDIKNKLYEYEKKWL